MMFIMQHACAVEKKWMFIFFKKKPILNDDRYRVHNVCVLHLTAQTAPKGGLSQLSTKPLPLGHSEVEWPITSQVSDFSDGFVQSFRSMELSGAFGIKSNNPGLSRRIPEQDRDPPNFPPANKENRTEVQHVFCL